MNRPFFLILALLLAACTERQAFAPVQGSKGASIESEVQRALFLKTGMNPKQLTVPGWDGTEKETREELSGVVYSGVAEDDAVRILDDEYGRLKALGYKLFLTNLQFDKELRPKRDLAVVKGYSDLDLLRKYDVSGPNYDITNEQVVAQVNRWQKHMQLEIVAFENDRFEAKILSRHYDVKRLADENYKLCPDVIEQGYGSREELVKGLGNEKFLWCWWD